MIIVIITITVIIIVSLVSIYIEVHNLNSLAESKIYFHVTITSDMIFEKPRDGENK